jgi:hypothetical protein
MIDLFYLRFYNPLVMAIRTFLNGMLNRPLMIVTQARGDSALIIIGVDDGKMLKANCIIEMELSEFKHFMHEAAGVYSFLEREIGVDHS